MMRQLMAKVFGQTSPPPVGPETAAVSPDSRSAHGLALMPYRNPDDLVWSRPEGLAVYQKMTADPYVKVALRQRKALVVAREWRVRPAGDSRADRRAADFVTWCLGHGLTHGTFKFDLYEMLDAMDVGFAVHEIVWRPLERGPYRGLVGLAALKSKNPYWLEFKLDAFANIEALVIKTGTTGRVNQTLPLEKFIVWPYLARYENPYGTSDLRAAYRAFWIKDTAWKLRAVFLERFAGNNLVMSYPAEKAGLKDELLSVIKNWQSETGIVVPEDVRVDTIKMAAGAQSEFSAAVADLNREILVGILGESLTVEAGKYGTQALGEVQDRAKRQDAALVAESLAAVVNQQLVRRLVDLNFQVDAYPEWTLVEPSEVDLKAEAEIDRILVGDIGLPLGRRYFYEKYGRPEPEPGTALIVQEEPARAPGRPSLPLPEPNGLRRPAADDDDADRLTRIIDDTRKVATRAQHLFDRAVSRIALSIGAQIKTKDLLSSTEFPVAINVSAVNKLIGGVRLAAHLIGRTHVREEIGRQADVRPVHGSTPEGHGFDPGESDDHPFSLPAVGQWFGPRLGLDQEALITLTQEQAESTFNLAGEIKDELRTLARNVLDRARKDGRDLAWLDQELATAFARAGRGRAAWWADLIWEAYGQGRWAELRANAVPALAFRVAADTEADDFGRRMDGFVAPADDPVWAAIRLLARPGGRTLILPVIPAKMIPSPTPAGPQAG